MDGIESWRPPTDCGPRPYFHAALRFARRHYGDEIDRISSVRFDELAPGDFFRELAWVVHATGFSAKAVGNLVERLLSAYGPWDRLGAEAFDTAFARVRQVCNNAPKSRAVHATAAWMVAELAGKGRTWPELRTAELSSPALLARLPYVGPVTSLHLARNVGLLECVKPDLHLRRLAAHWGMPDCEALCRAVRPDGMPLGVVDYVLWISSSTFGTLKLRKDGQR